MRGRGAVLLLVGALALAAARPAWAQPAQPTPQEKETARALYRTGNDRFRSGDLQGALEAFEGAYHIMPAPTTALGLGKTQLRVGQLVKARDTLLAATRYAAEPDDPASFAEARREAAALAEDLAGRIPSLVVRVTNSLGDTVAAAVLRIDGVLVAASLWAYPLKLDPGAHALSASAPGLDVVERRLELGERETRVVDLVLAPRAEPSTAAPSSPETPSARPPDAEGGVSALVWAGVGIGSLGVVVGTVGGVVSLVAAGQLKDMCDPDMTCPSHAGATKNRSLVAAHVSTAGFTVAGLGAVLGVVGAVLPSAQGEPGSTDIGWRLVLGPSAALLEGAF
ncbi:MAG: tetratricopeptide repeat protein [Myxococcales bacterium]|nr:tetratricopeptide repeat protein [Myxococcales bacterium]